MTERSPTAFKNAVNFTNRKAGSSDQKWIPNVRSNPGQAHSGKLSQGAAVTSLVSYSPMGTATARPAATVSGKVQRRTTGEDCKAPQRPTPSATMPGTRMRGDVSNDWPMVRSTINGTAETATNMMTMPLTVGVNTRRSEARRTISRNWRRVEATTKLANRLGPPFSSANTEIANSGILKFVTTRRPDPRCRNGNACKMMLRPEIANPVKTTQPK